MSVILVAHLALVIYTIYLVITGPRSEERKLLWLILIVFLPLLGPILYLLVGRNR